MVLRAKPEKLEERERTRLALLRATLLLAAKHGFAGLGLREVARGAGIAPTSFYRHFADMEELGVVLVAELVAPLLRGWLERTQEALASAREPANVLTEQAYATLREDRDLLRFVFAERVGAQTSCRSALRGELASWAEGLREPLSQAVSEPLPLYVAEAVLTLLLENLSDALESETAEASSTGKAEAQLARLLHSHVEPRAARRAELPRKIS
ncbi:MAG: transcriptional regulator, TetR family [Myxococcaceae bacterium]|nr:transcriptional regulator, TetR family [Myxococcaceae bacterium]